jgi:hypothetical protein
MEKSEVKKWAIIFVELASMGEPISLDATQRLLLKEDGTYSIISNDKEIIAETKEEAAKLIVDCLVAQ